MKEEDVGPGEKDVLLVMSGGWTEGRPESKEVYRWCNSVVRGGECCVVNEANDFQSCSVRLSTPCNKLSQSIIHWNMKAQRWYIYLETLHLIVIAGAASQVTTDPALPAHPPLRASDSRLPEL